MPKLSAPARQLLDVITRQLIPWATSGSGFVSLDAPPKAIGVNKIIEQPGKALPLKTDRYGGTIGRRNWEEENLWQALDYPNAQRKFFSIAIMLNLTCYLSMSFPRRRKSRRRNDGKVLLHILWALDSRIRGNDERRNLIDQSKHPK